MRHPVMARAGAQPAFPVDHDDGGLHDSSMPANFLGVSAARLLPRPPSGRVTCQADLANTLPAKRGLAHPSRLPQRICCSSSAGGDLTAPF